MRRLFELMETPSTVVLLVDDEPSNLRILSDALGGQGFAIAVARDGNSVLERVKQWPPDLILLDVLMPGMDGFEVCRRLKAMPEVRDTPVIFMTALTDSDDRLRGLGAGAVDFIPKTIHRDELVARVKVHLALREALRSLSSRNSELEKAREEANLALSELERVNASLESEVFRRTSELQRAKEELELELVERKRTEEERAALQKQIVAMSTPIIPISDHILVMPLMGLVDEERADFVMNQALRRIADSKADVMILDVTGVPRVDEYVANTLVQTARALSLLGTHTVLTGIRSDMARTFATGRFDLGQLVTKSTLQAGIAHARQLRTARS